MKERQEGQEGTAQQGSCPSKGNGKYPKRNLVEGALEERDLVVTFQVIPQDFEARPSSWFPRAGLWAGHLSLPLLLCSWEQSG